MNTTLFPAGLNDLDFEIYKRANQIYALNGGKTIEYKDFPKKLLDLIDAIIALKPKVQWALTYLGINCPDEARMQFISCNMANFDFTADVNSCLTKFTSEYVECNKRDTCPVQGKLCGSIAAPDGELTLRQLRVMGMIRRGLFDKEIADALFISIETVKTTKRTISKRLRVERKAMISNVAAIMQIN